MHGFIKSVIQDINSKDQPLSNYIFVLPNKRSSLFLKNEISKVSNKTIFSPIIYDIDEFMSLISGVEKVSDTELLFDFYQVYLENSKEETVESFEEFISWGKMLIRDFNEIDRELCETNSLFNYLEALKDLNHWSNYDNETKLIKNYKAFWKKIKSYHKNLNEILATKRKGYQGVIYRIASEQIQNYIENQKNINHVFIGFNALSKSESEVIQEILENRKGEIYWDIDENDIKSQYNNAGYFINSYFKKWAFLKNNKKQIISNEYSEEKNISVIGAPKNIGQIKYVGEIISKMSQKELENTAIILSDERLLIPMANSLPENIKDVNITMGFPYKYSSSSSLFNILLQIHSKKQSSFYFKSIISILSHELIKPVLRGDNDICLLVKKNNLVYISKDDLIGLDNNNKNLYELLFTKWGQAQNGIKSCLVLIEILRDYYSKNKLKDEINIEFLHCTYKIFNQIKVFKEKYKTIKSLKSLKSMYKELGDMNTIPFNGEPVKGLQIMGMLETRLLNYKNIIITSLNEGILPAGNNSNSFIPYEIKLENELQTFKEKDSIFAYHFYRIIKRAKNIWLTYNTEPDALNTGEISRFLRQIEIEKIHKINKYTLIPNTPSQKKIIIPYKKTKRIREKISELFKKGITASMLTSYVIDKERFFENYIIGVRDDEIEETIANNTLGNVIHDSLEVLYKPLEGKNITIQELEILRSEIEVTINKVFTKYVNERNLKRGKNVIIVETAKKYVERIIISDAEEIKKGKDIRIISIEKKFESKIKTLKNEYKIRGIIDRIDEIDGKMRIIDYKTGKKLYKYNLKLKNINEIRNPEGIYNLQLLFYMVGVAKEMQDKVIEMGIMSIKNMKDGVLTAMIGKQTEYKGEDLEEISFNIVQIIEELLNKDIKFEN